MNFFLLGVKRLTSFFANNRGVFFILASSFTFSIMSLLVKLLSKEIPSTEIVFFRSFIGLIILVIYINNHDYTFKAKNKKLLALRGFLGALGLLGFFYTVSKIKLGDASILMQSSPIYVVIFSAIFLKEKIKNYFYFILVFALIGTALIIKPDFDFSSSIPSFTGVLAAIFAGSAYVVVKRLSSDHSTYTIVLWFVVASSIVSFPLMLPNFVIPNMKESILLILVGITSTISQILMTKAYRYEKASIVSILTYSVVLYNIFWGYLIWGEVLDVLSTIGGFLILASCISISYLNNKDKIIKK
jgi:drug/metabolite transporter (DMT)-like permease